MILVKANQINKDIITIDNFFTTGECDQLIAKSEQIGYEEAAVSTEKGVKVIKEVRNNQRILYKDEALAKRIWERAAEFAPKQIGNSVAAGLNELFRFYKYEPGQRFKKHMDESFIRDENEASYYTFMVYLNDDYEGGKTLFDALEIKGSKGMCLIFLHSLAHEGAEVTKGRKYVLRTDIMYRLIVE